MPTLIDQQKKISMFAAHADVESFIHRARDATDEAAIEVHRWEHFPYHSRGGGHHGPAK
jgi:hypothetical protein